jgi:hypothetical protein
MIYMVEEIFRTEGVPAFTFVKPPNFNDLLVDIRNRGKPVIIEGQSGTGKTTTVRRIIDENIPNSKFEYLSARKPNDIKKILSIADGTEKGLYVIDDFHRLDNDTQEKIANIVKIAAEDYEEDNHPKIVIIGINKVGSELIHLVHDIAKRCGIHRIKPASFATTTELITKGEEKLNLKFSNHEKIFEETKGDYWLTQLVCQSVCLMNSITETTVSIKELTFDINTLRNKVTEKLEHSYSKPVTEFCRGNRFRSTNDPYFKLLRCVSEQESSIVDLTDLANENPAVRGSINNVKEKRLAILIESKAICERYFYYNPTTKNFAIEDPALFYYVKHLDWEDLRKKCGFRAGDYNFDFDFAISFAGENRNIAKIITEQLEILDCAVFFDELFEANYLGQAWHKTFMDIFSGRSRFVVCLLDKYHLEKIWPTFERECFIPRIPEAAVIPIYLDNTLFPGIPKDIVGIKFTLNGASDDEILSNKITDEIIFKLTTRLENI